MILINSILETFNSLNPILSISLSKFDDINFDSEVKVNDDNSFVSQIKVNDNGRVMTFLSANENENETLL